jgi:hypothetical protein
MDQRIFVEAKGTVGARSRLTQPLAKGKRQVENVQSAHAPRPGGDRLVFGTNLCIDGVHTRSDTGTVILDPEGAKSEAPLLAASDYVVRVAYAKVLNFADHAFLASLLLLGLPWPKIEEPERIEIGRLSLVVLAAFPLGGLVVIDERIWTELRHHDGRDLRRTIGGALGALGEALAARELQGRLVLLSNGVGLIAV